MLNFQCQGPSISTFSKHPNLRSSISINFEFLIFRSSISTTSSATSSSTGSHWTSNSANKLSKVLHYISYKQYRVSKKTHFPNGRFAKPGLTVRGVPLSVDCFTAVEGLIPSKLVSQNGNSESAFFRGHQVFHQLPLSHKSHSPSLI